MDTMVRSRNPVPVGFGRGITCAWRLLRTDGQLGPMRRL